MSWTWLSLSFLLCKTRLIAIPILTSLGSPYGSSEGMEVTTLDRAAVTCLALHCSPH